MTQDLRGAAAPTNMPTTEFHLICTRCGQRTSKVRFSIRTGSNICQPKCPKTN
jgi:hypothetical protein